MVPATKVKHYEEKLNRLLERLATQAVELRDECLHHTDAETAEGYHDLAADPLDQASLQTGGAVNIGLVENETRLRTEIDAALERIHAGVFGICAKCEAVIGARRLNAIPYARYCVRCERRIEQAAGR